MSSALIIKLKIFLEKNDDCKTFPKVTYKENCAIEFAASNRMISNYKTKFNVRKDNEILPTYDHIDIS